MITDILPGTFACLGAPDMEDTLGLASRIGSVRQVLVVLVDGLGARLLPRAAEHSAFFADIVGGRAGQLTHTRCTVPSTTPTSLVSLTTGVAPGQHGILGFTVNVPGTDRVLRHITWGSDPDPRTWQPVPTVFERAGTVASSVVLPAAFEGSGLTSAAYRGADFHGLRKGDDLVESLHTVLSFRRGLVLGYTARIDTAAHAHGIASAEWAQAAEWTGAMLQRIVTRLPSGTALVVTADHGGLDVPTDGRIDLDTDERLSCGVRIVAGEPRLRHLHTVPGAAPDVAGAWASVLGAGADVMMRDDAVASGLFGPVVADTHLGRIGDVVVVCRGDTVVMASAHESPEMSKLVGFHGSTTPDETDIPVITFVA